MRSIPEYALKEQPSFAREIQLHFNFFETAMTFDNGHTKQIKESFLYLYEIGDIVHRIFNGEKFGYEIRKIYRGRSIAHAVLVCFFDYEKMSYRDILELSEERLSLIPEISDSSGAHDDACKFVTKEAFDYAFKAVGAHIKLDIALKALGDVIRAGSGKDDQSQSMIAVDALVEIRKVKPK